MPARSAALGVRPWISWPRWRIVPPVITSNPKAARISSDLPQPTSPAMPTTSPARTWIEASSTNPVGQRQPIRFKQYRARRTADLREQRLDRAAGHQFDQLTIAHVTRRAPS